MRAQESVNTLPGGDRAGPGGLAGLSSIAVTQSVGEPERGAAAEDAADAAVAWSRVPEPADCGATA